MSTANIKLSSKTIESLKKITGEATGNKAVQKAIWYFIREAKQRNVLKTLESISFDKNYDPLDLRRNER